MKYANKFDVIVIGGGPAGISSAIWCSDLGMTVRLIEKEREAGGQLLKIYAPITNYPGVETSDGKEMRDKFVSHLERKCIDLLTDAPIASVDLERKGVKLVDGNFMAGRSMIIATGVRRRRLGIPGEEEFRGHGVLESGVRSRGEVAGKHVVIIGGGDAAVENALILSEKAARVMLVHRRENLTARDDFINELRNRDNVEVIFSTVISEIGGTDAVENVVLTTPDGSMRLECDLVLIRIGVEPNSEVFADQLMLDESGYIVVDGNSMTSVGGVYAAGDVTSRNAPTISTAVGMAATAAKKIRTILSR